MKIGIISNLYRPFERGGAEKVAYSQAIGLSKAGHEIFVVSTKPTAGLELEKTTDAIKIYRFKPVNLFYYLDDYKHHAIVRLFWHIIDTFNLFSALQVKNILKKEKPDLIITHNLKGIGLLIPRAIKKLGIKHTHILHDVQLSVPSGLIIKGEENAFLINGWPTRIYEWVCRKLFGSPDVVVSPSNWLLNFYLLKKFFPKSKTAVIRNPLDFQTNFNLRSSTNRFLFAGQLEKHKGIDWLVNIWQEKEFASELWVAGKGNLKLAESSNVKLLGQLTQEELIEKLRQVDFLILPSLCYENSPTIIPLAFACGTPVIGADIGGAGELIDEYRTGFRFAAGDKASFLDAFEKARSLTGVQFEQMQQNCLDASQEFTLDEYLNSILKLV